MSNHSRYAKQPKRVYKLGECDRVGKPHKRGCGCTVYVNGLRIERGTNKMRRAD